MTIPKENFLNVPSKTRKKQEINNFVIFGDSLSDAKNMGEKASFLGSWARWAWLRITGLDKSPKERFTNGYTWSDALKARLVSKFVTEDKIQKDSAHHFSKYNLDNADIGDDILTKRREYTKDEVTNESNNVQRKKRTQDNAEIKDTRLTWSANHKVDSLRAPKHQDDQPGPLNAEVRESSDDLADQFITDLRYSQYAEDCYTLENGRKAQFNGQIFLENKSQGGSTAYDYSWKTTFLSLFSPLKSLKLFFTRLIISNVPEQITEFLNNNEKHDISKEQKEKTLITLFSGANDLITANAKPSKEAADLAVKSIIDSIDRLRKQGYSNFIVCNLPDLSLTPRFQNSSDADRDNAHDMSEYFNTQLQLKYDELKLAHPHSTMELFDIKAVFSEIYNDVLKQGAQSKYAKYFDQNKLKEPYIYSKDFDITPERTSPGCKHMFWDDVHPTATMHALLMERFVQDKTGLANYDVSAPKEQSAEKLCHLFREKYHEKLQKNFLGLWPYSQKGLDIDYSDPQKALISILEHALEHDTYADHRLRDALIDLGWWSKGPNMSIPAISDAMWILNPEKAKEFEKKIQPSSSEKMSSLLQGAVMKHKSKDLELAPVVRDKLNRIEAQIALSTSPDVLFKATTISDSLQPSAEHHVTLTI